MKSRGHRSGVAIESGLALSSYGCEAMPGCMTGDAGKDLWSLLVAASKRVTGRQPDCSHKSEPQLCRGNTQHVGLLYIHLLKWDQFPVYPPVYPPRM